MTPVSTHANYATSTAASASQLSETNEVLEYFEHPSGGCQALERHLERVKLPVRERVTCPLNPCSAILEISQLAGLPEGAASAGVAKGIGVVHGSPLMVIETDASVKGDAYFPWTEKKSLRGRAQDMSLSCQLGRAHLQIGRIFSPKSGASKGSSPEGRVCRPPRYFKSPR